MAPDAEETVKRYATAIGRVAAAYERDRHLREDLVQDILLSVVTALPRLRDPSRLTAFVFRIAHNRCVNHVIRRQREPKLGDWPAEPPSETPTPEQAAIDREGENALLAAIRSLTLPYRQVITLLLEGLSYEEISRVVGASVGATAVRINRAKQQLRDKLGAR